MTSHVFGQEHTINQLRRVFNDDLVETMQKAAVQACEMHGEPL